MNIYTAIAQCFPPEIYCAMKGHLSPPEMLNAAAIECFCHKREDEVANTIRNGLNHLRLFGLMPKDDHIEGDSDSASLDRQ